MRHSLDTSLLSALSSLNDANSTVFLACSGGRDSLSLAYACYLLYHQKKISALPILLHVHHGMQSLNDTWATQVADWAKTYGFVCHILKVNLTKKTETQARQARYRAMASMMTSQDILLLAHHANDQAETVLMRLISGAGIQGLSAIKRWQSISIDGKSIKLHRPWLSITRKQISDFATAHQLPYVDDPTNNMGNTARNIIRTQILPTLETLNPQTITNIVRSSCHIADSVMVLDDVVQAHLLDCIDATQTQVPFQSTLSISRLLKHPIQLRSAIIHRWMHSDNPLPPTHRIINEVLSLIIRTDTNHQTQILWRSGTQKHVICRYQDTLYCYLQEAWQLLHIPSVATCHTILKQNSTVALHCQNQHYDALMPVGRYDTILVGKHKRLAGKKLYQTLKIPPWLRHSLWTLKHKQTVWLVAPLMTWQISQQNDDAAPILTWRFQTSPLLDK